MNYLSRSVRFLLVCLLLLSCSATASMEEPTKESTEEVKKLEKKKETLQWEINSLEKKIATLKSEANQLPQKKVAPPSKETVKTAPKVQPAIEKSKESGFVYWNPNARRQTSVGPAVAKSPVVAPAGTITTICVPLFDNTVTAPPPLKLTVVPVKPEPLIVTSVPSGPEVGTIEVMLCVGTQAITH